MVLLLWVAAYAAFQVPSIRDYQAVSETLHLLAHIVIATTGLLMWLTIIDPLGRNTRSERALCSAVMAIAWIMGSLALLVSPPFGSRELVADDDSVAAAVLAGQAVLVAGLAYLQYARRRRCSGADRAVALGGATG
jgi:cytochrome c oxidase assembly factor CtaG